MNSSPSAPSIKSPRSGRRWLRVTLALIVLSVVASGLAFRFYQARQRAIAILGVHEEEEAELHRLQKVVHVRIDRHASIREWLAEFTRQTGIAAEAMPIDFDSYDGKTRQLVRQFDDTFPVNIELPPARAMDLLDTLAHTHDVQWTHRSDGSIEFSYRHDKESIVARQYALPNDLTPEERAALQGLLWKYAQYNYDGARINTIVVRIGFTPAGCTIVHSLPVHLGVPRFLEQCLTAMQSAEDSSSQHMLANLEHCPHTWLHIEEATIRDLEAALDCPITLSAVDMPWPDFAAEVSRQASFPIALAPDFAKRIAKEQPYVACRLKNVPLRQLAEHMPLPSFNPIFATKFAVFPTGNGRALLMGEHRGDAMAERHHFLCAYPVDDLTLDSEGVSHAEDLESAILGATDGEWGTFHLGNYKMDFFLNGQLMVVSQRLEVHRKLQRLLTALRRVRGGDVRSLALANDVPAQDVKEHAETNAELRAILSRPMTLQYSGVRLADVVQDLRDRTDVRLMPSREVHAKWNTAPPVWCYLPKRPLGENMRILFQACGYDLIEQSDQCRVVLPPPVHDADGEHVSEVFDLRPWLHRPSPVGPRLIEAIPRLLGHRNWSGRLDEFRELLVVSCPAGEMAPLKEILPLLNEHVGSGHPRRWRGELLTGDRLNQPLVLWKPADAPPPHDAELNMRLQQVASASFNKIKVADALLTLASRYELPLVIQQSPSDSYNLQEIISYQAEGKPLREILQELIGDPLDDHWQVQGDSIRIVQNKSELVENGDDWYSVHDLLLPIGSHRPDELLDLLQPAVLNGLAQDTDRDPPLQIHIGNLLKVRSAHVSRGALEKQLRQMRTQEAQP